MAGFQDHLKKRPKVWRYGAAAAVIVVLLQLAYYGRWKYLAAQADRVSLKGSETSISNPMPGHLNTDPNENAIPNLVHYVWVMRNLSSPFSLKFKHFVSIYSANLYFHPDTIYIHTDALNESLALAKESGDIWTRRILNTPNVVVRQVEVPTHADNGVQLTSVEHRSDFVRPDIMYQFGGIYMDLDVVPIRDIQPLRYSGFRNIMGHEKYEGVNNGAWMSQKGSALMKIFEKAQHEVYDGEWTTHSVKLLTRLSNSLMPISNEILILERKAFTPTSWEAEEMIILFLNHPEAAELPPASDDLETFFAPPDINQLWEEAKSRQLEEWELDFSSSYAVHAMSPTHHVGKVPGFTDVTLDYVLQRQSNYARVTFPAVWHALKTGAINLGD
jgi:hypothetical protein